MHSRTCISLIRVFLVIKIKRHTSIAEIQYEIRNNCKNSQDLVILLAI